MEIICVTGILEFDRKQLTFFYNLNIVQLRELSEDEKKTIELSEDFRSFLDHSTRVIERALDEVDVDIDYSRSADDETSNQ